MKNEWIWSPANIKGEDNYPQIYIAESTTIQNLDFHSYTMSELQNFVSCRIAFVLCRIAFVLWLYISWEWHSEKIPDIVIGIKSFAKYIALKWPILLTFYPFFQKVLDCKLRKKKFNYMTERWPSALKIRIFLQRIWNFCNHRLNKICVLQTGHVEVIGRTSSHQVADHSLQVCQNQMTGVLLRETKTWYSTKRPPLKKRWILSSTVPRTKRKLSMEVTDILKSL